MRSHLDDLFHVLPISERELIEPLGQGTKLLVRLPNKRQIGIGEISGTVATQITALSMTRRNVFVPPRSCVRRRSNA
jgi:hypothetical protein